MASVTKEVYLQWEAHVIAAFFDSDARRTALVPAEGSPSILRKEKWILVADSLVDGDEASRRVAESATELAAKQSVRMWHVGSGCLDNVSYGLVDDSFSHPACDVGGLTNLRQKLGAHATFVDGQEGGVVWPSLSMSAETLATMLHAWWCQLASKQLPASLREGLVTWLESVAEALPDGAKLRFHALAPEHRVVASAADVRARTGSYYVRVFGGGGSGGFACESDGDGLFCAITDKYVTPNINLQNLHAEYTQYADTADKRPRN